MRRTRSSSRQMSAKTCASCSILSQGQGDSNRAKTRVERDWQTSGGNGEQPKGGCLLSLGEGSPANQALHLTGPASRFSETSRSLQPARQVNAVVRPLKSAPMNDPVYMND